MNFRRVACSTGQTECLLAFDVWLYASLPWAEVCPAPSSFLVGTDIGLHASIPSTYTYVHTILALAVDRLGSTRARRL